ncbi:MAG: ParA family protein [Burkholderiales bacterium]
MPVIVVANPKGGVGKTTLSTNIAGYYASRGHAVMLGDVDRQQSARTWLSLRPAGLALIAAWEVAHDAVVRPPKGTTHVVLDTPAGLHGKRLDEVMKQADKVLIPLQPSIFDIHATHEFVRELLAHKRGERVQLAIVGMRTREGTIATDQLRGFLDKLKLPLLGFVRDTQNYVHLAAHGLTLWDVSSNRFERDIEQWRPITAWLDA